jgi:hypothetical protein
LTKYHDVIYKIWHTAWPQKNAKMLVEFLPDVEQGANEVANAALPGILRDKNAPWAKGVKELLNAVADYRSATKPLNETKLLDAAEKLHMQYEKLVRVIRPALKEIEGFHSTLYVLYHYAMPEGKLEEVKTLVAELPAKMSALNAATLPERMKAKNDAFVKARTSLSVSVDALVAAAPKGTMKELKPLIDSMHAKYEALDKVFE